jgi:hypothetical protein
MNFFAVHGSNIHSFARRFRLSRPQLRQVLVGFPLFAPVVFVHMFTQFSLFS